MKIVAVFLCMLVSLAVLPSQGAAQVRLNEILADPNTDWNGDSAVDSRFDEWVEIANVGNSAVDLSRFRISDASAATDFRFALSGNLAPGQVRVYYGSEVVAWQQANGVGAFGLSLNNSGDTVTLYEVNGSDTTAVDSRQYVTAEVADDRSTGRMPSGTGSWVIFDGLNPYTGTQPPTPTGCVPSPGTAPSCPTPTQQSTWGGVKAKYRG